MPCALCHTNETGFVCTGRCEEVIEEESDKLPTCEHNVYKCKQCVESMNKIQVLETMDVASYRRGLVKGGAGRSRVMAADDETIRISMHKSRVEMQGVRSVLRLESIEWLRARGYGRLGGLPLPPVGVLPA